MLTQRKQSSGEKDHIHIYIYVYYFIAYVYYALLLQGTDSSE